MPRIYINPRCARAKIRVEAGAGGRVARPRFGVLRSAKLFGALSARRMDRRDVLKSPECRAPINTRVKETVKISS